jgi:hypothetical protein
MNDDYDDLDRALFALPLATPPAGMREAILRATIFAQAPSVAFRTWEVAILGTLLAVGVWLSLFLLGDPERAAFVSAQISFLTATLAAPATLVWLAAGTGVAASLTLGLPPDVGGRRLWRS